MVSLNKNGKTDMTNAILEVNETDELENSTVKASRDKFYDGAFEAIQPSERGNRSGMDALLLAAALPKNSSGIVADLGAGAGVAGFAALTLNRDLELLAVEKNATMVKLAKKSLQLNANAKLFSRAKVIQHDVTLAGKERVNAGLTPDSVNHIIMNPPYNTKSERPPLDSMKAEAFMMGEGGIDAWFRTAASIMSSGGTLAVIYRTENLGEILACSQGRFGGLEIMPIHSRSDEAAKRIIIRGTKSSRAPMTIVPGFVVHQDDGSFTQEADAIFKGKARLEF